MTHDELIAYIDDSTNGLKHEHLFEKLLANTKALRTVAELHKSKDGKKFCKTCGKFYPCSTIQVIEKKLT
jgi:hypothetical protein